MAQALVDRKLVPVARRAALAHRQVRVQRRVFGQPRGRPHKLSILAGTAAGHFDLRVGEDSVTDRARDDGALVIVQVGILDDEAHYVGAPEDAPSHGLGDELLRSDHLPHHSHHHTGLLALGVLGASGLVPPARAQDAIEQAAALERDGHRQALPSQQRTRKSVARGA
eukprot:jgi/Chrpa1/24150/Chrysochromulina_OHIO_Genome00007273-RA